MESSGDKLRLVLLAAAAAAVLPLFWSPEAAAVRFEAKTVAKSMTGVGGCDWARMADRAAANSSSTSATSLFGLAETGLLLLSRPVAVAVAAAAAAAELTVIGDDDVFVGASGGT